MRRLFQAPVLCLLIFLASVPLKLAVAQNMPWDIDIVPVLSRGYDWLEGGAFPAYGTLSSVAAYNMPALQWLHLPALALTRDAYWSIILTMFTLNLLSTGALYRLGSSMFNARVGLAAATLFTFSEAGVSSAYTAWAQHFLPAFYVLTFLALWEWYKQERGYFLALAGILATLAFMTHFSAILLYPAMLVFALLSRTKWQWGWLVAGSLVCLALLSPYLLFERERDFADLRAFLSQETLVAPEIMQQYEYLKEESGSLEWDSSPKLPNPVLAQIPTWQRALNFALSIPMQYWRGLNLPFASPVRSLEIPFIGLAVQWVGIAFWGTVIITGLAFLKRTQYIASLQLNSIAFLLVFIFTLISGLILSRNSDQTTYFMGLIGLQILVAAIPFGMDTLPRFIRLTLLMLLLAYVLVNGAERLSRLAEHDDAVFSRYNVSLYRHVEAATDYIAQDWQGGDSLTVSYDILPEMRNLWWVAPWSHVDLSYRIGMNFDFLLDLQHGLENTNTNPLGLAKNADYIVVYAAGLGRYDLSLYQAESFGAIYVLERQN